MLFLTPERFLALAGTETAVLWHAFFNVSKHVLLIHFLKSKLCSAKVNKLPTSAGCKRDPDAAENQNSHLQKSAGQNQNLLRHCPSHKILLDPPRAGPGCSLVLTVWHIWEKFIWSYCSSMSSTAAAQTIHTGRFLWLWVSHTQGKCWKQAQTSDSQHITPSSCSTSVSAHPPLKINCLKPKACVLSAGWPFWKTKGREGTRVSASTDPQHPPGAVPGQCPLQLGQDTWGGLQAHGKFSLAFHTNQVMSLMIFIKFFRALVHTEIRHLSLFQTLQARRLKFLYFISFPSIQWRKCWMCKKHVLLLPKWISLGSTYLLLWLFKEIFECERQETYQTELKGAPKDGRRLG